MTLLTREQLKIGRRKRKKFDLFVKRLRGAPRETIASVIDSLLLGEEYGSIDLVLHLVDCLPASVAVSYLLKLYEADFPTVRYDVLEMLEKYNEPRVNRILVRALSEKDPLVRAGAAEALGFRKEMTAKGRLIRMMSADPSPIVRACAATSLGFLGNNALRRPLATALNRESVRMVRLRIMGSLWLVGEKEHFRSILKHLSDHAYRNRCAAANILSYAGPDDAESAKSAMRARLCRETSRAVKTTIASALRELSKTEV